MLNIFRRSALLALYFDVMISFLVMIWSVLHDEPQDRITTGITVLTFLALFYASVQIFEIAARARSEPQPQRESKPAPERAPDIPAGMTLRAYVSQRREASKRPGNS